MCEPLTEFFRDPPDSPPPSNIPTIILQSAPIAAVASAWILCALFAPRRASSCRWNFLVIFVAACATFLQCVLAWRTLAALDCTGVFTSEIVYRILILVGIATINPIILFLFPRLRLAWVSVLLFPLTVRSNRGFKLGLEGRVHGNDFDTH